MRDGWRSVEDHPRDDLAGARTGPYGGRRGGGDRGHRRPAARGGLRHRSGLAVWPSHVGACAARLDGSAHRRRVRMTAPRKSQASSALVRLGLVVGVLALIWTGIWLQLRQERIATERDVVSETANLALA